MKTMWKTQIGFDDALGISCKWWLLHKHDCKWSRVPLVWMHGDACSYNADKINKWTAHVNQNKSFILLWKAGGYPTICDFFQF